MQAASAKKRRRDWSEDMRKALLKGCVRIWAVAENCLGFGQKCNQGSTLSQEKTEAIYKKRQVNFLHWLSRMLCGYSGNRVARKMHVEGQFTSMESAGQE
jgi:hypothetical protein